jgi:hypothetical protein
MAKTVKPELPIGPPPRPPPIWCVEAPVAAETPGAAQCPRCGFWHKVKDGIKDVGEVAVDVVAVPLVILGGAADGE